MSVHQVDHTAEEYPEDKIDEVELPLGRLLLATDGSAPAVQATQYAVALAKVTGATVTAVYVLTADDVMLLPEEILQEEVTSGVHASQAGLALAKKFAEKNDVRLETEILRGGIARQIVQFAESGGYDLIVMGDAGRTGWARLTMGSVSEAVVRASTVPVLVIKR